MLNQLSKRKSTLMMAALLFATLGMCGDVIIIPGADQMLKTFQNDTFVNFMLSGPNLISMFASIAAGKIMAYVDQKKVLLIGMACFFVGGTFGVVIDDAAFMIVMRCLVGLSLGFVNVTAMTIVTAMYMDENRRSRMVGILNGGMFCSAAILTALSGLIAETYGFKAMFWIYGIGILVVALIIFFVPKIPPGKEAAESDAAPACAAGPEEVRTKWISKLAILCAGYLVFQITYAAMAFYNAVYADEKSLGGAAFSGTLSSALFIGALAASLLFGFIYPKLKRNTFLISVVCVVVGYALFIFTSSPVLSILACAIFGYANANAFSQVVMRAGVIAPAKHASFAVSIVAAVMGVGFFLSTYTIQAIESILDTDKFVAILPVLFAIDIALLIVAAIYLIATGKRETTAAA